MMIRMTSLEKETLVLSEPSQLAKSRPLAPKNGLHGNSQQPLQAAAVQPVQPRVAKRRYSMGAGLRGVAKRRRRANSDSCQSEPPVLPSHFLLGGNIFDPLNLNSLLDDSVNRATNQSTPVSSPLPVRGGDPVEILVPRDITDPLNLKGGGAGGKGGAVLLSPLKQRKRHRHNRHPQAVPARLFTAAAALTVPAPATEGAVSPLPCELNTAITCRDDVAPPPSLPRRHTLPAPSNRPHGDGRQRRRRRTTSERSAMATVTVTQPTRFHTPLMGGAKDRLQPGAAQTPQKKKDKRRYQHGNHSRHYGYHGFYGDRWEGPVDPRLRLLQADWFRDKKVLDVGCGEGHMALAIARRFGPAHILGLDRDTRLVHAATQNTRHFLSHDLASSEDRKQEEVKKSFPLSFRVSRGPLAAPPLLMTSPASRFPSNITFIQGDYVSDQEAWPGRGLYDVILCLGVTKWVQLQNGDVGVARLFSRAYQSLSPGGLFILEPQPWSSYCHSKRASESTFRHFRTLRLRPDQFTCYLTDTVGFSSYRLLTHTDYQRPIYLFHKGPSHRK